MHVDIRRKHCEQTFFTSYTQELSNTASLLGVNIDELDAWGQAVSKAGGDAKTFQSSLHSLAEHLGTNPRVALQALVPLAEAFAKLGRFRALQYGKKLGLDEPTILLLQRSGRTIRDVIEQQRKLGVVTQHDKDVTDEYTLAVANSEQAFNSLSRTVASDVLPVLTRFFNEAATPAFQYLTDHKDLIEGALYAIGIAATAASLPFLPWLAAISAVTLALGTLAVAYEDVKFFLEGKDSFIGQIINTPEFKAGNLSAVSPMALLTAKVQADLVKGQNAIQTASNSPIGATASVLNSSNFGDKNSTVNITELNIVTQSTDAEGIAREGVQGMEHYIRQAMNQVANGRNY